MNITLPTTLILKALKAGYEHGFDILDVTGLPSGTVYPALRRLEREGLIESEWEPEETARENQRPSRRYYKINAEGEAMLETALRKYRSVVKIAPKPRTSHASAT